MTVCVAAHCIGNIVFGASDRMLTAGDVEFEPDTAKIIPLTTSIAAMTANDSSMQSEICRELRTVISEQVEREPAKWLRVRDVAYLYARIRNEIRKKRAEQTILLPFGLDQDSFISRQKEMADVFVNNLTKEMINFDVPSVETIISGVDETGSHIYTVENDTVRCHDSVGFAAIGIGYWHANSQFMLARYSHGAMMPDTLLLTYIAKKRAEVSPGVGKGTDMFMIGPALGSYTRIWQERIDHIDRIFQAINDEEKKSLEIGRKEMQQYVEKLIEEAKAAAATKEQAAPQIEGGGAPADGGAVPEPAKEKPRPASEEPQA